MTQERIKELIEVAKSLRWYLTTPNSTQTNFSLCHTYHKVYGEKSQETLQESFPEIYEAIFKFAGVNLSLYDYALDSQDRENRIKFLEFYIYMLESQIQEDKNPAMIVHVPYPWMWKEVERYAASKGIKWKDGSTKSSEWHRFQNRSCIEISGILTYSVDKCKSISFAEFCKKTGHEPKLWGVRGGKNAEALKKLFEGIKHSGSGKWAFVNSDLHYGIDIHGEVEVYWSVKEVSIEEAYELLGREMPKEPIDRESLLKIVKENYPEGTKVRDGEKGAFRVIRGELKWGHNNNTIRDKKGHAVYLNGNWRPVLEKPIFTNSIGQHFYESENPEVYWWDIANRTVHSTKIKRIAFPYEQTEGSSEIFMSVKDVLQWVINNI